MPIVYKKPILPALKAAGYSSARLRKERLIGQKTMQDMRNGELVSWRIMEMLCKMMHCQPGDLVEYVPDDEPETEQARQNQEEKETTP